MKKALSAGRHGFGEAAPLAALLEGAGFSEVRVRTVTRTIRFEDGAHFLRMNAIVAGMSAVAGMTGAERERAVEAIVSESVPVLDRHGDGSGVAFELGANLATAKA